MEQVSMIEKHQGLKIGQAISVRPFLEDLQSNMGLEKYNMVVFENIVQEEPLAYVEQNGIRRYITGLNEFAPELNSLNPEEKEAKIKQIRSVVAKAEREIASNIIDEKDEKFWEKVKILRPDNHEFWNKILMRCSNDPIFFDPEKDIYDLIKIFCIEARGFSIIAPSLEEARKMNPRPKWFLDKYEETISLVTEVKKLRNKALSELQDLYEKNITKLFYICKVIDINSTQYRRKTPHDVLYDSMDRYINGEGVDKNKRLTAKTFIDIAAQNVEVLKIRALIKDATFYKIIGLKGDGYIYHIKSNTLLGKNPSDVAEYLRNPLNSELLETIMKYIENYWNN